MLPSRVADFQLTVDVQQILGMAHDPRAGSMSGRRLRLLVSAALTSSCRQPARRRAPSRRHSVAGIVAGI